MKTAFLCFTAFAVSVESVVHSDFELPDEKVDAFSLLQMNAGPVERFKHVQQYAQLHEQQLAEQQFARAYELHEKQQVQQHEKQHFQLHQQQHAPLHKQQHAQLHELQHAQVHEQHHAQLHEQLEKQHVGQNEKQHVQQHEKQHVQLHEKQHVQQHEKQRKQKRKQQLKQETASRDDNLCTTGIRNGRYCCGSECGTCGGRGCQNRPGGEQACCASDIRGSGRRCNGRNMQNCLLPRVNRGRGMGGSMAHTAGPEPELPPTDITEPAVVEELSLCERSLQFTNVVRNNLGGAGPDGGEEGILFGGVLQGKDLLVSATSAYTPNMLNPSGGVLRNGARQGFGVINMASGSSVDLEFTLKDSVTGAESPDSFVMTFFDGDHGMSHESREIMTLNGMSNFIVDDSTELEITETAIDDASLASGVGVATFTSTLHGSKEDNPVSPLALSGLQEKRSVEVYFENKAKFTVTFAATGYVNPQGRNMFFAGASTLTCAREARCSSYECPLGWRLRQDAEFTDCSTKPCSIADNDRCCFEEVEAVVPP